jgi:hypothetical protein
MYLKTTITIVVVVRSSPIIHRTFFKVCNEHALIPTIIEIVVKSSPTIHQPFYEKSLIPTITNPTFLVIVHLLRACETAMVLTWLLGNTKDTFLGLHLFT